jgi:hypothetical protein
MGNVLLHTVRIMPAKLFQLLLKWAVNKHRYQNGPGRNQNRIDVKMWPKGLIKFDIIFRSCLFFKDTTGRYTLVRIRWDVGHN